MNGIRPLGLAWCVMASVGLGVLAWTSEPIMAQTWDFSANNNLQGWQLWGNGDASNLTWTSEQGKNQPGCLKLTDAQTHVNPYAVTPLYDADNTHSYTMTGWYKSGSPENPVPGLSSTFYYVDPQSGTTTYSLILRDRMAGVQTNFSTPDANGWRQFAITIPRSLLASAQSVNKVRWSIQPTSTRQNTAAQGLGWMDDIQLQSWDDQIIDLRPIMTTKHSDGHAQGYLPDNNLGGWTDKGNDDLRNLYTSTAATPRNVFNIPFEIVDPSSNATYGYTSVISICDTPVESWYQSQRPLALSNKVYDRIYLLHTSVIDSMTGPTDTLGYVDVTYSDASVQTFPIRLGHELGDWNGTPIQGKTLPWVLPGWTNDVRKPVSLYVTDLTLARPVNASVTQLAFRAETGSTSPWMIFSATASAGSIGWLDVASDTAAISPDFQKWPEFVPGIHPTSANALSLEFLLDPPAGKHGVVQIVDGHLRFEDETPARFWGTNVHAVYGLFPTHEQADQAAATLARYGVNLVRLFANEAALIDRTYSTRDTFVTDDKWEKLEYFIHALKQKGIYILLDSISGLSSRDVQAADGVTLASNYNPTRSWAYYDSVLRQLGLDYMQTLLTHPNRHEGHVPLGQDPALAAVTVINEQSLFWDLKTPGPMNNAPYYNDQLKTRFNAWLLNRYGTRANLQAAWSLAAGGSALGADEDPVAGTVAMEAYAFAEGGGILNRAVNGTGTESQQIRTRDNVRFLQDLQTAFYQDLKTQAQNWGLSCPVIGTNIITDLGELKTHLPYQITAQNHYWNHCTTINTVATQTGTYYVPNVPETHVNPLNSADGLSEMTFTATKTSGQAMAVTETDTMWPNEWRSSHLLGVAAVGALQGHDLLLHYNFAGGSGRNWDDTLAATHIMNPTMEHNDPAIMSSVMAGAFLFLRGDVQTASELVQLQVDQTMELAMQMGFYTGYPANYLAYVTRFENQFLSANQGIVPPSYQAVSGDGMTSSGTYVLVSRGNQSHADNHAKALALDANLKNAGVIPSTSGFQNGQTRIVSATGQIVRDWGNQIMTINTPKSQGFTGFPSSSAIELDDLTITSRSPFATFQVSSLDGQPLTQSPDMLMIAVARAENSSISRRYTAGHRPTPMGTLRGEGLTVDRDTYGGPVRIEPVKMTVEVQGAENTQQGYVRLTPLNPDMTGRNQVSVFPVDANNRARMVLEQSIVSPWYRVERRADQGQSWTFAGSLENWGNWGYGDQDSVIWDAAKGHGASGSVRVYDNKTTSNPYTASPLYPAHRQYGYRLTGWYWTADATQPGIVAFFFSDAAGTAIAKIHANTDSGVQYQEFPAGADGWKRFAMYVPASSLSAYSIASVRFGIRSVPNATPNSDIGKTIWIDDVRIEQLQGHASNWDYDSSSQNWQSWGYGDQYSVMWDSSKGHTAMGCLRLYDNKDAYNPYAASPLQTADSNHGYRISGWYWTENGSEPGLFIAFYNVGGTAVLKQFGNTDSAVQYEVSPADSQGWRRFTMYVPRSSIASYLVETARFCVRPVPNNTPLSAIGTQMWIDELTLEAVAE